MAMTTAQTTLRDRVLELITGEGAVREVSMFGGRSVMLDEKMIVSALTDGALLDRVDADRHEELLARPGAAQAEMGAGRDMGPGWIEVAADAIADEDQLAEWIGIAMEHRRRTR